MKLVLDTTGMTFQVTAAPEPKKDNRGAQRAERDSGRLLWITQVLAEDEQGGEVISITTAGEKPDVTKRQLIVPVALEAKPWVIREIKNGQAEVKTGTAYMAITLKPFTPAPAGK